MALIFALKTLFFSLAVALIPVAAALRAPRGGRDGGLGSSAVTSAATSAELSSLVRLFSVILLIELASLLGNYH